MIYQGCWAAIKLGEEDVPVEGLAVMLKGIKARDGTGPLKQDNVRMRAEILDDVIDPMNSQSMNPRILMPGIMLDKDSVDEYPPKS